LELADIIVNLEGAPRVSGAPLLGFLSHKELTQIVIGIFYQIAYQEMPNKQQNDFH
jgi:hypothetical protein